MASVRLPGIDMDVVVPGGKYHTLLWWHARFIGSLYLRRTNAYLSVVVGAGEAGFVALYGATFDLEDLF